MIVYIDDKMYKLPKTVTYHMKVMDSLHRIAKDSLYDDQARPRVRWREASYIDFLEHKLPVVDE